MDTLHKRFTESICHTISFVTDSPLYIIIAICLPTDTVLFLVHLLSWAIYYGAGIEGKPSDCKLFNKNKAIGKKLIQKITTFLRSCNTNYTYKYKHLRK